MMMWTRIRMGTKKMTMMIIEPVDDDDDYDNNDDEDSDGDNDDDN